MAETMERTERSTNTPARDADESVEELQARDALLAGTGEAGTRGAVSLDLLMDVPMTLSIEVGRSRLSIREVLALHEGAVVLLDRQAGEPLEVFVNGALIARGEVVVVNDTFGIRLTDVVNPDERMGKLK
jgi:flagellar motor switch protein FliN/FliY